MGGCLGDGMSGGGTVTESMMERWCEYCTRMMAVAAAAAADDAGLLHRRRLTHVTRTPGADFHPGFRTQVVRLLNTIVSN